MNCRSHQTGEAAAGQASPLTDHESDMLLLAALGYSDKHIAGFLRVSVDTVDRHRLELCRKLGLGAADGLGAALALALAHGAEAPDSGRQPAASRQRPAGAG